MEIAPRLGAGNHTSPYRRMTQSITRRKVIGIDLGTTFCAVAHIDPYGKPQIIPNSESERLTPSVILFDGVCTLCNGFVQFVVARDPSGVAETEAGISAGDRRAGQDRYLWVVRSRSKIRAAVPGTSNRRCGAVPMTDS